LVKDKNTELAFSTHLEGTHYIGRAKPISDQARAGLTAYVAATYKLLNLSGSEIQTHLAWAGEEDQLGYLESDKCKSVLIIPVLDRHSQCVAVLKVENKKGSRADDGFDEQDSHLLDLIAQQVAIAIEVTNWRETYGRYWIYQGLEDDLHEIVNLLHSGVFLRIEAILKWLEAGKVDKVLELMPKLKEYAHTGIKELRSIHSITRSPVLESEGLASELNKLVQVWEMRMIPTIKISFDNRLTRRPPPAIEYSLYRIAQCALANAATHSKANLRPNGQINIELWQKGNILTLCVEDNGNGFNKEKESGGYGLTRMKHWADQIKADLDIQTEPGQGTIIVAQVLQRTNDDD
jgi:nitrate/nitrite-specific signal transduction histidine kinase